MGNVYLECKKVTKHFGQTQALNEVDISFERGIIHGLIGENGSGKSTLTSIAAGLFQPTAGEMFVEGEAWHPSTVLNAYDAGIRIVVQEAGTIPNVSVAQNIFMGYEQRFAKGGIIRRFQLNKEAQKALDDIGCGRINASASTRTLDMESRKLVELARAAYGTVNMFIVDETTTALSQEGRTILYNVIHSMAQNNVAVVLISHDLAEIQKHCDKITVLRDGCVIGSLEREEFSDEQIQKMMIGRDINTSYYRQDNEGYSEEVVLKADNITTRHEIMNLSIELHKGEILGVGGLSECGMHTLGKALYGYEAVISGNVINCLAGNIKIRNTETAEKSGMAYVSKNRDTESLALNAPILENIASTGYKVNRLFGNVISRKKERKYVIGVSSTLSIKCNNIDDEVKTLSGGNKQKVAFGKWIAKDSDILILDCPTRGVDIGVKAAMYELIDNMKKAGKSIIMISEELPELIGMSDRLVIMKNGKIAGEFLRRDKPTEEQLIKVMI